MKLEVGDCVRVYHPNIGRPFKAIVTGESSDMIKIQMEDVAQSELWVYPQQCRKLFKKVRREFWIRLCKEDLEHDLRGAFQVYKDAEAPEKRCYQCEVIRVREVKEKK